MNKRVDCPSQRHQNTEKKTFFTLSIIEHTFLCLLSRHFIFGHLEWCNRMIDRSGNGNGTGDSPESILWDITYSIHGQFEDKKENKHKKTGLFAFPGYKSLLRCRMTFVGPPQNVVFHRQMCSLSPNCKVYKLHTDCMLIKLPVEWMFAFASVCFCADFSENRNCTRNIVDTNMANMRDFIHLRFPWDKYSINCISGSQGPSQKCYCIINDAARWI